MRTETQPTDAILSPEDADEALGAWTLDELDAADLDSAWSAAAGDDTSA